MAHDASKVVFGSTQSSDKAIVCFDADPADFPAGTAVRIDSDGALSVAVSDGGLYGVSAGKSLSDTKKTAVVKFGDRVPVLLTPYYASATITISNYSNLYSDGGDVISVGGVDFVAQNAVVTEGDATFRAATGITETRDSLLAQINSHETSSAVVIATAVSTNQVLVTALLPGEAGNDIVCQYADSGESTVGASVSDGGSLDGGVDFSDYAAPGKVVYISDTTGYADIADNGTASGAVFLTSELTGLYQDGSTAYCALVDMGGGL